MAKASIHHIIYSIATAMFRSLYFSALSVLFLLFSLIAVAQKENNIWYAPFVSLDFNPASGPVFIPAPAVPANGQPAGICDSTGALLFYTNGNIVYGKDHLPMPNGTLADGAALRFNRHPCSALILPKGGTQYYLFSLLPDSISVDLPGTAADTMIQPSLYYSIIDMQLNGGNGDVLPGSKKILLKREVMRAFLVGNHGPGCDSFWVTVHLQDDATFLTYPVTAAGVGFPVPSTTGVNYLPDNKPGLGFYYGKFSPDGTTLALFSFRYSIAQSFDPSTYASLELIDFDAQTGIFSNARSLYENLDYSPFMYGFFPMSFSPDSKKLYTVQRTDYDVATWNKVSQYDLSLPTIGATVSAVQTIGTIPPVSQGSAPFMNDMRLGPDGRIYIASGDLQIFMSTNIVPLARINTPDALGAASGFESGLSSPLLEEGFPVLFPVAALLPGAAASAAIVTQRLCLNAPLVIGASRSGAHQWHNGSNDSSITVTQPGIYWVHTTGQCVQHTDTFKILPPLSISLLPGDTTVCKGNTWTISLPAYPDVQYTWQDGSTGNTYQVNQEGMIVVSAQSTCGIIRDSMRVTDANCNCDYLFVPTAFSPNADGVNDVFLPRYPCSRSLQFYELKIYNRWGQVVFSSNARDRGWDGTMAGHKADIGVYYYTVKVWAEGKGEELFRKGSLTLLR